MIQYRKILDLSFKGLSQRTISTSVGSSRQTVSNVIKRANAKHIVQLTEAMTDRWLEETLFPEKQAIEKGYQPPDWEVVHKELQKKNMTLKLLHQEYMEIARDGGKLAYSYRSFAHQYGTFASIHKATMPLKRKPGDVLEIDWAGSKLAISDRDTGQLLPVYLFVATLPYSQYSYVEGFLDMKSANWLTAHIHAFEFFKGVPQTLVIDNLKTGVVKPLKGEPILNEAYRELADYYQTVIVPARVRHPKDKASVEGAVGLISRQIIAALRNYQCFDLRDLNQEIWNKLNDINERPFQKRPGSRKIIFDEEESSYLHPLRRTRFKLSEWRVAKVQPNYHIQLERMYYSLPYEYIQDTVDVRLSQDLIEVYFNEVRIASHKRLHGVAGQYSTLLEHMPDRHRAYLEQTPAEHLNWARAIGCQMEALVKQLLDNRSEQQVMRQMGSLYNIARNYTHEEMEHAAETLMQLATMPTVSVLKTILVRNRKRVNEPLATSEPQSEKPHGFVRGASYFGGKRK